MEVIIKLYIYWLFCKDVCIFTVFFLIILATTAARLFLQCSKTY